LYSHPENFLQNVVYHSLLNYRLPAWLPIHIFLKAIQNDNELVDDNEYRPYQQCLSILPTQIVVHQLGRPIIVISVVPSLFTCSLSSIRFFLLQMDYNLKFDLIVLVVLLEQAQFSCQ